MNLDRVRLGEAVERLLRQRRRPVLDRAAQPVPSRAARDSSRQRSKSTATSLIEPSARTMPPWLVPVWTLILLIPGRSRPAAFAWAASSVAVAAHEAVQILDRVLRGHLADLAADRDGDPGRLPLRG